MMKNEIQIKQEVANMRNKTFQEIETILRRYNYNDQDMLASFVSAICDVDYADMLSASNATHIAQARWLYWMALRYMTHDTYQRISERTQFDGHKFAPEGIGVGITKITNIIEEDETWKRRWLTTKRMIKLLTDPHDYPLNDFTVCNQEKKQLRIQVPKGELDKYDISIVESTEIK